MSAAGEELVSPVALEASVTTRWLHVRCRRAREYPSRGWRVQVVFNCGECVMGVAPNVRRYHVVRQRLDAKTVDVVLMHQRLELLRVGQGHACLWSKKFLHVVTLGCSGTSSSRVSLL